jgi:hypothetical protein
MNEFNSRGMVEEVADLQKIVAQLQSKVAQLQSTVEMLNVQIEENRGMEGRIEGIVKAIEVRVRKIEDTLMITDLFVAITVSRDGKSAMLMLTPDANLGLYDGTLGTNFPIRQTGAHPRGEDTWRS